MNKANESKAKDRATKVLSQAQGKIQAQQEEKNYKEAKRKEALDRVQIEI